MSDDVVDPVEDFRAALNNAAAVFGIARSALPIAKRELGQFAAMAQMKPAELVHLSLNSDSHMRGRSDAFAAWPLQQLEEALGADGAVARQIGHQWVVHVYHLWEGSFREEIALTRGLNEKNELQNAHFGDLARIRHDILKHRGVASRRNAAKCVELKWFKEGDAIHLQDWMIYEFMEAFGVVYPAVGEADPEKVKYPFRGLMQSPVDFLAPHGARDRLVGRLRSLSGRPLDLDRLRAQFCGTRFALSGPGGVGEVVGLEVWPDFSDQDAATVVVRAPLEFVGKVKRGEATAKLALGAAVPQTETRTAVRASWLRDRILSAEAAAPEGKSYDLTSFLATGRWLPLVSSSGDMFEGKLLGAKYIDPAGRRMQILLEVSEELIEVVERKAQILRLPIDLGRG